MEKANIHVKRFTRQGISSSRKSQSAYSEPPPIQSESETPVGQVRRAHRRASTYS